MTRLYNHPILGALRGRTVSDELIQFLNIPYGSIRQRFARSKLVERLPSDPYDATQSPPASIQPLDAATVDCKGNQFPTGILDGYDEEQSEPDCLKLNVTIPSQCDPLSSLPVLVFVHGGAFYVGASTRPYYDPTTFCSQALQARHPHVFVSMNYRLGALGFLHSTEAKELMSANRGLHDQRIGFEWIKRFIAGFGGDPHNITAIGQSAGGMSLTIHNLSADQNVWSRSIQFSGSLVTMPICSPQDHHENFLSQAKKLGIDIEAMTSDEIAHEMMSAPVDQIRDLEYVGLPCYNSSLLPYEPASMALSRQRPPSSPNLQSQMVGSATYDGGISYNMLIQSGKRKDHAATFIEFARKVLESPKALLDLYGIKSDDEDTAALRKICQFESDIGFFAASLSQAQGFPGKTYLLIFDLGNPFEGPLPYKQYAIHTWDIAALLGAYEDSLDDSYRKVVREFREKIILYALAGEEPWPPWTVEDGSALMVGQNGLELVNKDAYMGTNTRRGRLLALAEQEAGDDGCDLLWDRVCRPFLMKS